MVESKTGLPSNLLPPQSIKPFVSAAAEAFSIEEARRLSTLPRAEIRKAILTKKMALGGPLTRLECDKCLKTLSLALPRAGLSPSDAHDMLKLYFSLLSRAGITGRMLVTAVERYIMAPAGGKGKFFPDPGQLAEMCADDLRARDRDLQGLERALAFVEGPVAANSSPAGEPSRRDGLRILSENLAALTPPAPPLPISPRAETDAGELQAALQKRMVAN